MLIILGRLEEGMGDYLLPHVEAPFCKMLCMPWQPVSLPLTKGDACLVSSQLIEVQAEYHRKSLTLLQAVLPQIKAQQGKCRPSLEKGGPWCLLAFPDEMNSLYVVGPNTLPNRITCR